MPDPPPDALGRIGMYPQETQREKARPVLHPPQDSVVNSQAFNNKVFVLASRPLLTSMALIYLLFDK